MSPVRLKSDEMHKGLLNYKLNIKTVSGQWPCIWGMSLQLPLKKTLLPAKKDTIYQALSTSANPVGTKRLITKNDENTS